MGVAKAPAPSPQRKKPSNLQRRPPSDETPSSGRNARPRPKTENQRQARHGPRPHGAAEQNLVPEQEAEAEERPEHVPERHPQGGDHRDGREPEVGNVQEPRFGDREPGPDVRPEAKSGPARGAGELEVPPSRQPSRQGRRGKHGQLGQLQHVELREQQRQEGLRRGLSLRGKKNLKKKGLKFI